MRNELSGSLKSTRSWAKLLIRTQPRHSLVHEKALPVREGLMGELSEKLDGAVGLLLGLGLFQADHAVAVFPLTALA